MSETHDHDERQPWQQSEGEPSLWFDRFERFRLAGPRRSLLATHNAERTDAGELPATDLPGAWKEAARRYDWRNRASTWDAFEQQLRREKYDEEREEDHEARVLLLKVLRSKLVQALNELHPGTLRPSEIVNGVRMVVQELRAEYDDLPTQHLDLESMTDDELRQVATGTRTR